jgi:glyoxylase-like metal-dependent hydrolase (beta-lactamase superfamily II)
MQEFAGISRRAFNIGFGATAVLGSGTLGSTTASAKAPIAGKQLPGAARMKVGNIEVTALCDGYTNVQEKLFPKSNEARAKELRAAAFLRPGEIPIPVNAYLINTGDKLALIDAGNALNYGPTMGHLPAAMKAAGVDPKNVDVVIITHVHPDHTNGLLTPTGERAFPNAELVIQKREHDFWNDPAKLNGASPVMKRLLDMAIPSFKPYAKQTRMIEGETEVLPGIRSVPLYGHTPGHTGYMVSSGSDTLLVWGDIVHLSAFQLAEPEWSIAYDVNPEAAIATRKRTLDMVAADRIPVVGGHLPFPGKGHIQKAGTGYQFVPAHFEPSP